MKNSVFNLRTAKAQAGCAKLKDTSLSFRRGLGRGFLFTFLLLTLGVGQIFGKVVYYNNAGHSGNSGIPKVYAWDPSEMTDWNGSPNMTKVTGTIYSYDIGDRKKCIFRYHDGSKWQQTDNLNVPTDSKNYYDGSSWSTYNSTYTVTYNANGGSGSTSSHTSVTPSSSVTLRACGFTKSNHVFAGWNTASDGTGTYYAPGASYTVTANRTFYAMWVPTAVLGGTKVMAYCGELTDWNQSTYKFTNSSGTQQASVTISGSTTVVDNTYKTGAVTLAPNTTYYNQGHSGWSSGLDCKIQAGYLYVVRGSKSSSYFTQKDQSGSDYLYEVSQQNSSTAATRTVTTTLGSSSFAEGTSNLSVSTSGGPGKSVLGRTNKLLYFLYNGSTWSLVQLSAGNLNVSSLTEGSYSLASVLTDGYIYVRADKDDFNVYAVYSIAYKDQGDVAYTGSNLASLPTSYNHGTGIAALTAGEKTGYNFAGWYANSGCTGDAVTSISSSATGDKTFYAKWTAKTTTITLNNQGATTAGTVEVTATFGSAMPAITLPTKTGYTFGGYWGAPGGSGPKYYNADGSSAQNWNNTESTYTLFAKWTENMSTVSLVASPTGKGSFTIGGDAATSTTAGVTTTRSVTAVAITGYHFVSWAITGGATISGTTDNPVTVTGDGTGTAATLTATFEVDAASYTITYGVGNSPYNNGTVSEGHSYASGSSQTAGTQISLTATPTNAHYKLAGWYSEAACSSAIAGAGTDNPYVFDLSANTSVYAKLVLKQCTITLNKNGGSTGASSVTASHGSTLPSFTAHSRTGYTLDGYYTDPSTGTKIIDASGALVASTTYANASKQWNNDATSLTLYAHWTAKQTTVTLNQQSGSGGTTGVTATYDAAMPDADMPTRTGYTFGGYYTNTGGAGTQYYTNTGASARNWDIEDATKTLYAKWTLITYTITYNNMTGATNHPSNPANYNVTTATITLGTPTKAGYDFGGWFTDNGTWNNQVTSIALGSTGNKVLYAKWTAKTYDITYVDANNVATIAANPATGSTDATINFTVTMKPGFKSLSVTAVDAGSNTVTVTNPSANTYRFTMPASNVTVTVTATALPIVYVLKTKHANSSLGDDATGLPSTATIWAWKFSGSNNFYTSPGDFPGPTASSKATAITDDIIGDEWYRFIPDNTSYFDGSTAYHVILTSTNRILDTETTFIENGSSHSAATHTGTIWIVPHGTEQHTAYVYTSYPDEIVTPYNVTYNAGDHGSINVFGTTITSGNSQTIATTKNRTLTASPASGYAFNRWITTGSVTVADATSATTTVTATGTGTVTATYFEEVDSGWYIQGNINEVGWSQPETLPLNRLLPGETNVYYRPVTLPGDDRYFRFWHYEGGVKHDYSHGGGNDCTVTKGTKYNISKDKQDAFKYSVGGTVWFVVDESAKKCWLQDPVEFYSVNFGYSDGCKTFSAKDGEGNDLVSGNTYVSGTELTFTQTKKDGYTFVGWNTAADGSGSSLGTGSSYSVASLSADVNVYAIYTENKTAITITTDGHGTITTPDPNESPYSLGVATTQAINATASDGYHWNTWTVSGTAALVSSASTQSNTVKGNGTDGGTGTVTATFTPNTYRVQFHRNGGAGVVVHQDFTYDVAQNLTANSYTRTGYNFAGWALTTDGAVTYANGAEVSNLTTTNEGTFHLYAKWTPKQCPINFDFDATDPGHGSHASATTSTTATYAAAMPSVTPPTAAQGYAFMGYYDAADGTGTKYYNANGTSARTWNKNTESATTLYAYYKKAEITNLALSVATVAPSTSVTATPEISPTPVAPTIICWKLLRANGNPLADQPTFTPGVGNAVSFTAPSVSGSYKVAAVLRTGSVCNGGTVLDSVVTDLVVAGSHTVTIRYQDGDGRTLAASGEMTGKPLEWSDAIEPATITGYTFARWEAGDGVYITDDNGTTTKTTTTTASIKVKASYDGNLTAVYTKKRMIYFNNTLGWGSVYVYFYKNDSYWNNTNGTGAQKGDQYTSYPFSEEFYGAMTPIEGTNIWYFDCEAAGVNASYVDVVFTEIDQLGYNFFHKTDGVKNKVIRRGDYSSSLPMYVPVVEDPVEMNDHGADYYKHGYWMNYPENTGYTLKIYNAWNADKSTAAVREYPFPYSEDQKMPLKLDIEFNDSKSEYWFMVYRNDGLYYGNTYTFNQNYNSEQKIESGDNKSKLVTSAAGIYTLTLTYHADNSSNFDYYIDVDFPVAVNDYRIVYKDNATWSNSAHGASWYHPSDVIVHIDGGATEDKKDIVSFYIAKGEGITTSMKFQYASAITDGGAITWTDVDGGTIDLSDFSSVITKAGVYNFHINQPTTGGIEVESVEPYTGTYYIRTDCAGNTKWDSYTTLDHQMTYSDYAAAGSDGFTHYYCHWVTAGTNVKFVIANDYSVCISDTLEGDTYTTQSLAANANIRFMYDERTNIIKRAYISGSGNITDRFLVLEGDAKMYDENGNALTGVNQDHDKYDNYLGTNNQVILHDDENFVYERTIKVNATARAKLTAKYNNKVQYFKGTEGAFADGTTIQLLGGTYSAGSKYTMRIVYDFKTNRLVTAYMPEGEISGEVEIQADMMLIREHQGEATQLTFASGSDKLTDVKSVYGVMRFNRWTLNNRQHPEDMDKEHSDSDGDITTYHPLVDAGSMKSISERGLYWVSFPFDVNLSDVFGFGTYGTHWIMMRYNGTERARIGYWKDNDEGFWEYIWDRRGVTLEKGQGYVLALELDLMKATDRTFWSNEIQQVELFFPSVSSSTGEISQANVDVTIPSHECTIDRRTDKTVDDWNKDRRIADSHWNIIGVPSYANYGSTLTDGSSTIEWHTSPKTNSLPFLYEWNANDNTYTVQSGTTYPFKAMHAYYVQYAGTLHWTLASATPSSIVARRTYAEKPESVEFKLELMQNEKMIDQTFVKMSDDEEVSANFAFGEDLNKEKNAGKANIYTLIENYMPAAGNTLPMSDQTTVVPVGVTIAAAGEYTFAIPDGTSGVGVTLVDTETNERTNLSALDYTVNLTAGTCDGRFLLEISPVSNTPTGLEPTSDSSLKGREGAEKRLIDNKLFIITEDGKVFDARGAMVK